LTQQGPNPRPEYDRGSVVSYDPVASAVGSRILIEGGNAVDAAVATGLALAVTYPQAGNLAGGGFMLIAPRGGEVEFLDYRETAPRRLHADLFLDANEKLNEHSVLGATAVGVPGTMAGFEAALERHGTMTWAQVVAPVIELAESGYWLTTRQAAYLARYSEALSQFESTRRCFKSSGTDYLPGSLFRQPELGRCLRLLAERGPRDFYEGTTAELIADEIGRGGGVLELEDLRSYKARWRAPLRTCFRGKEIFTAPLPSGGGLVIQTTLKLLESCGIDSYSVGSRERYELLGRCFRVAFALRHRYAGDPDFFSEEEREELEHVLSLELKPGDLERYERTLVRQEVATAEALGRNTTHFCILDVDGNAVSNTYSLNTLFGSKLAVSGGGFLLNNSMDDFRIGENVPNWYGVVDGPRNQLLAGRRPVGSMSPTIVRTVESTNVELILGGSGGPTIPSLIVQAIVGIFVDGKSLSEALDAPRVHHQFQKPTLYVEDTVPGEIIESLFNADPDPVNRVLRLGIGVGIERDRMTGRIAGALDKRFSHYANFSLG
jgi:gamma-glutamyltranspeptidase/glutathione hydrolase